jgi:hypothetical protein
MVELQKLESAILAVTPIALREIKTSQYKAHAFEGVYMIYRGKTLVKIGKTSGRSKKKERKLAARIRGLTFSDSVLRLTLKLSLAHAERCTARCLQIEDALLRGRFECYLMAKYFPEVNHAELKR